MTIKDPTALAAPVTVTVAIMRELASNWNISGITGIQRGSDGNYRVVYDDRPDDPESVVVFRPDGTVVV